MDLPIFQGFGWHVPDRSEGRGIRENHALRKASGRATFLPTFVEHTRPNEVILLRRVAESDRVGDKGQGMGRRIPVA